MPESVWTITGFPDTPASKPGGFPKLPFMPARAGMRAGLSARQGFNLEDAGGRSLTLAPFLRYDSTDPRRTHADLREAYLLLFGEFGEGEWELRAGVARVFWGVAESQHLVDIVNQVDLVEHPGGKAKLGQPMVHLTWSASWGALELFGLPFHRARTFPGRSGRLRLPLLVDEEFVEYESGAGERNLDLAARYSHSFRSLDFGMSCFQGTSREPSLEIDPGREALVQSYAQIRQFGIDAQLTAGSWLFKLEGIHRAGALTAPAPETCPAVKPITSRPFSAGNTPSIPRWAPLPISACWGNGVTMDAAPTRPRAAHPIRSRTISSSRRVSRSTMFRVRRSSPVFWETRNALRAQWL